MPEGTIDTLDARNWVPLRAAAGYLGVSYWVAWRLVSAGTLTRGRFSPVKNPPVFVHAGELAAYAKAGADGVAKYRQRASKRRAKAARV